MKARITAFYSLFIGVIVIDMWLLIFSRSEIKEGGTEISFHLFSEFLMAIICIIGAVLQFVKSKFGRELTIAGLAMVIYSVLNAAGYYGEKGDTSMMIMFIVLFAITAIVFGINLFSKRK